MITKIALIGPACTGKTTLANLLTNHFHGILIEDYMNEYVAATSGGFDRKDIFNVAKKQTRLEDLAAIQAEDILIADTTLLKLKIWSEFKFGSCDEWIISELEKRKYDYYLLLDNDIQGVFNHPVEQPSMSDFFLNSYENYLKYRSYPYAKVTGNGEERLQNALGILYNNEVV